MITSRGRLSDTMLPTVNLDTLNPQQLTAVKKQLDEEVEHLTSSFTQLAAAQGKLKECLRCVQMQASYPRKGKPKTGPPPLPYLRGKSEAEFLLTQEARLLTPEAD